MISPRRQLLTWDDEHGVVHAVSSVEAHLGVKATVCGRATTVYIWERSRPLTCIVCAATAKLNAYPPAGMSIEEARLRRCSIPELPGG